MRSLAVMGDYYVGSWGFRVSGGLSFGGYELTGELTDPTIDDYTYTGTFDAKLAQDRNVAPTVAVGYQRKLYKGLGVALEAGARLSSMTLTTSNTDDLSAADQAELDREVDDINDDLDEMGVIPYISLAVSYRF